MNQVKGAIQDELDAYFEYSGIAKSAQDFVSKAAFCKARRYLNASAFVELRDDLNREFYASDNVKTWRGHRLCAVDGSKITLPNTDAILEKFGGVKNKYTQIPQATLSQCYDPLNGFTLDTRLSSSSCCERSMAVKHLEKISGHNVFLYDRGYPGYWSYRAHAHHQQYFCMRVTTNTQCKNIQDFLSGKSIDKLIDFSASDKAKRICSEKGYISEPLRLRMIKVFLPSGEVEVLVSNLLDQSNYPAEDFSALYFKRWSVEEDFKQQKHTLLIERFSGKSITAVMQDIEAKVLTKNIARLISLVADDALAKTNLRRKNTYQINFKQLISKCKHSLIKAFMSGTLLECIEGLLGSMMRYIEPVRKGRMYPRKRLVGTRSATHGTYKGAR